MNLPHAEPLVRVAGARRQRDLKWLLAGLATMGPFSIDTYMPAFPAIGATLGATALQVQQTLSVYLAAFAVMMLLHGPLSDAFGRRPIILASLLVFSAASAGCALSGNIGQLLVFRALQGISAGAGLVVGRAIIRDMFAGHEAQRLMAQVTMIFGIAPAVAPVIGGFLHGWFGWHAIFAFLTVIGVTMLLVSLRFLPETLPPSGRSSMHPRWLAANYRRVLGGRRFRLLSAAVACNFAGFFLYIASAPVYVIEHLKLGPHQFAWLFLPSIAGVVAGAYISGRLAGRLDTHRSVQFGYRLLFLAAGLNLAYSAAAQPAIPWAVLPIMLYTMGMSVVMPSVTLTLLDLYPRTRGLVSSLQGFVQTTLNALVAGLIAPLIYHSVLQMALAMLGFLLLGWLSWRACASPGEMTVTAPAPHGKS